MLSCVPQTLCFRYVSDADACLAILIHSVLVIHTTGFFIRTNPQGVCHPHNRIFSSASVRTVSQVDKHRILFECLMTKIVNRFSKD